MGGDLLVVMATESSSDSPHNNPYPHSGWVYWGGGGGLLEAKRVLDMAQYPGYPLHRENRKNGPKKSLSGKHREFGNLAKTQGIGFAQVVNSLILKVKDISIFSAKIPSFNMG